MISIINGLPAHVAAFEATGKVTEDDYFSIINPLCAQIEKEFGRISYMLVIKTPLSNYSAGAWIQDALLGFRYLSKWRRLAIVSEKNSIKEFTDVFGNFIPPKTKGFMMTELELAKSWVAE
jgi:SpoIIAA-like